VQGPESRRWLADVMPEAADVKRFHVATVGWRGVTCIVAGTGYTGEDGVEIAVASPSAPELWEALLEQLALHTVTWRKVKGHAGVELNERCDELAVAACRAAR